MKEIDHYYLKQQEPNRGCLQALRTIILSLDDCITESLKWGTPCFSYKKKMFCFIAVTKEPKTPYLLLVEGLRIEHPMLELGKRTRMKSLPLNPLCDLPIDVLHDVLQQALELYRSGQLKTPIK